MARRPRRIVEAAMLDGIGPITAQDLIAMPENSWGLLRDRITDHRQGRDGLLARCMACEDAVYIRTAKLDGTIHPLFAHYSGSDPNCRWYHGRNAKPDDVRAAQYGGRQESNFHRLMCLQVAALVALDPRYVRHTIAEYLPPIENEHGRFPDVFAEWREFGAFAVEFQMSGTFQTEISARCKHYEHEGIPLLWILFGIDTSAEIQQSFRDVIRRHRGNAFVLDPAAITASKEQKTLILTCYLRNPSGFDPPKLVRFDKLTIPKSKLPYHEDRIATPRLKEIDQRRRPWFRVLADWDRLAPLWGLELPQSLLVAAAFSIVATANGRERNYASGHPNIRAMLNTYLHTGTFASYSELLTQLIGNTSISGLLTTKVGEHLRRHRGTRQVDEQSPEWSLLQNLLPEALDPLLREELKYLDALPNWASPLNTATAAERDIETIDGIFPVRLS